MASVRSLLRADFVPINLDLGLLVFRVWIAAMLMGVHGLGKLQRLMAGGEISFLSVYGLDPAVALALAIVGEVVAPALIIVGLATRWSAFVSAFTMGTAFVVAHGAALTGEGNGELPFLFMSGMVLLVLTGAGRYSLDGMRPGV